MKMHSSQNVGQVSTHVSSSFTVDHKYPTFSYSSDFKKMIITLKSEYKYTAKNEFVGELISGGDCKIKMNDRREIEKKFELVKDNPTKVKIIITDKWIQNRLNNDSVMTEKPTIKISNSFEINSNSFGQSFYGNSSTIFPEISSSYFIANNTILGDKMEQSIIDAYKQKAILNNIALDFSGSNAQALRTLSNNLVISNYNSKLVQSNLLLVQIDKKYKEGETTIRNPFFHPNYCYEAIISHTKNPSGGYTPKYGKYTGSVGFQTNFWTPINIVSLIVDLVNAGHYLGVNIYMAANHAINFECYDVIDNNKVGYVGKLTDALKGYGKNADPFFSESDLNHQDIKNVNCNNPLEADLITYKKSETYNRLWNKFLSARIDNIRSEFFSKLSTPNFFSLIAQEVAPPNSNGDREIERINPGNRPKYPTPILNLITSDVSKLRMLNLERGGFGTGVVFFVDFLSTIYSNIYFDLDKFNLITTDAYKYENPIEIDRIAKFMFDNPCVKLLEIQGHTSSEGDLSKNMTLSTNRAASVYIALLNHPQYGSGSSNPTPTGKLKITADRLCINGYGPTKPDADDVTVGEEQELNRKRNRRVVFKVLLTN